MDEYQRVFAKINLDAVKENFKNIVKAINPDTRVLAVLKTDGYGHGAIPIARELENEDKLYGYALATSDEAFILRNSGIKKPLLILGYTFPNAYEELILKDISLTVFREDTLEQIAEECRRLSTTQYKYRAKIHIKLDTGMGRIGIMPDDSGLEFVKKALSYDELIVEGVFSHLAKADEKERTATDLQLKKFADFTDRIENELGYNIPLKHISNSAGIIEYPEANYDLVRAGIILYGLWPSDEVSKERVPLRSALSLYSQIVYIKEIERGTPISYGGTFVSDKKMTVATVTVGYGDGYPRMLSNKAYVLAGGVRCPILGRICMDQLMVDVTDATGVKEGDFVTLIGKDGTQEITMEELGELSGRFNYELACELGKRIPRVYSKNNEIIYKKDYSDDF
ncbi:MAG: alanine racemase [Lachnospiraceae bacterium]|nr:alanine racemase [Lachnospiraceae bacterium]